MNVDSKTPFGTCSHRPYIGMTHALFEYVKRRMGEGRRGGVVWEVGSP